MLFIVTSDEKAEEIDAHPAIALVQKEQIRNRGECKQCKRFIGTSKKRTLQWVCG
jgi:hypothetical protein